MNSDEQDPSSPFEDPALKAAAVRAWASEKAPPSLRARVERMLQETPPPQKTSRKKTPQTPRQRLMWGVAAVLAVAISFQIKSLLPPSPPPKLSALPNQLYDDLITRHDTCSQPANHRHAPAPETEDAALTKDMQAKLSQAVLVVRPTGWFFRGAAICPVGDVQTGHLLFSRGTTTLSIFSLPQSLAPGLTDGCCYETTINNHLIVSFSKNGGLFCLVASDPTNTTTLAQLVELRKAFQASVTPAPGCALSHPSPTGELTYAINTSK